mgnify:CR=1 FL=1
MNENNYCEIMIGDVVAVTLGCGRNMLSQSNYSQNDCGWGEEATSNQTQATCC